LPDIDEPFLFDIGQKIGDADETPSGLMCPSTPPFNFAKFTDWYGRKQKGEFRLPICFFSSQAPKWKQRTTYRNDTSYEDRYETKCEDINAHTHVALITYDWIQNTVSTSTKMLQKAMFENSQDPELNSLAGCDMIDIPDRRIGPPRVLRPIIGGELTAPDLPPAPDDTEHLHESSPSSVSHPSEPNVPKDSPMSTTSSSFGHFRNPSDTPTLHGDDGHSGSAGSSGSSPVSNPGSAIPRLIETGLIPQVAGNRDQRAAIAEISVPLGPDLAAIVRGPHDEKFIVFRSTVVSVAGPEVIIGGHRIQFSEDTVTVDGVSTYQFTNGVTLEPTNRREGPNDMKTGGDGGTTIAASNSSRQTSDPLQRGPPTSSSDQGVAKPTAESKKKSLGVSNKDRTVSLMSGVFGAVFLVVVM
jgi:hypothetical protein